jgi:hypothetical protein
MATTLFSALLSEILVEVPGVSDPLAEQALRNAAIEFCERTWVWRVDQEPLPAEAGIADYELELPDDTALVKVLDVWFQGDRLTPAGPHELACEYDDWANETGTPKFYTQQSTGAVILLVPKPDAALADALTAKLAVKPARAATGMDADVLEKYFEAIAFGAKANLLAMSNKPWSNAQDADRNRSRFASAMGAANVAASKGHVRAPKRVPARFI